MAVQNMMLFAPCEGVFTLQKTVLSSDFTKSFKGLLLLFSHSFEICQTSRKHSLTVLNFNWHFERDYHPIENIKAFTKILIPPSSSPCEIQLFHIQCGFVNNYLTQLCFCYYRTSYNSSTVICYILVLWYCPFKGLVSLWSQSSSPTNGWLMHYITGLSHTDNAGYILMVRAVRSALVGVISGFSV